MLSCRRVVLLSLLSVGLFVPLARGADDLAAKIEAVTNGPDYKQAR